MAANGDMRSSVKPDDAGGMSSDSSYMSSQAALATDTSDSQEECGRLIDKVSARC